MHQDARPVELTERALWELNEQSVQEMEQPRSFRGLYVHEP